MKTLIIDNGSKWTKELSQFIDGEKIQIDMKNISSVDTESFNLIILSGSHGGPSVLTNTLLDREFSLVKESKVPIIGVCYGAEVIAHSYGGILEKMEGEHKGMTHLYLENGKELAVYEAHRFRIKQLPEEFIVLGRSDHSIEYFKHKDKPLYGIQFHPEAFVEITEGQEVWKSILNDIMSV